MICEKDSRDIYAPFDQPAHSIHAICLPLATVDASIRPYIHPETLSFIIFEVAFVTVFCVPTVTSLTMFHALNEVANIFRSVYHSKFPETVF